MTVYKRGKKYAVRIRYANPATRRDEDIRRIVGFSREEAKLVEADMKRQIAEAKAVGQEWTGLKKLREKQNPKTFTEAANDYMAERAHFKPSTLASYNSILNTYLLPEFGSFWLKEVRESQIRKFQARLREKISASRTNTVLQLLRSLLGQAYREGDIERDPSLAVKRLPEIKTVVDPLSEDELISVLSKIDPWYRPLFTTLAYTGMRPNETLGLHWGDVDWEKKQISINKGLVRGYEGQPKTASSNRLIPMLPIVEQAILAVQNRKLESFSQHIFTDKKGAPIRKHLDRIWARALNSAGLRHRPSYQLRHTFASACLMKGLEPGYVARLLGHTTLETMYRHYARWISTASQQQEQLLRGSFSAEQRAQKRALTLIEQKGEYAKASNDEASSLLLIINGADEGIRTPAYRNHNPGP